MGEIDRFLIQHSLFFLIDLVPTRTSFLYEEAVAVMFVKYKLAKVV